jgi:flagellar biosynthesis anti-sigma factor FlgM
VSVSVESLGSAGQNFRLSGVSRAASADSAKAAEIRKAESPSANGLPGLNEVSQYVGSVQGQPPVRADRVNALKAQVANGTYQVPIDQLADRLAGIGER